MWDLIVPLSTIMVTVIGAVWSLAWWLSHQFSVTRNLVYEKIEKLEKNILEKLEYHERLDDSRFDSVNKNLNDRLSNLQNNIWDIRVRNAAVDGMKLPFKDQP